MIFRKNTYYDKLNKFTKNNFEVVMDFDRTITSADSLPTWATVNGRGILPKEYDFERNVLYHFDFIGDKLQIGKFCSIAKNVKFIMNGGSHRIDTFSSYPFPIFGGSWAERLKNERLGAYPKGDTVIGNDVWLCRDAVIMPGVHIGDGAVIAAESVVVSDVPPYSIYGGNPAKLIKKRFSDEIIQILLDTRIMD